MKRVALVHCPAIDIFGTYFPAWMLCLVIGIVGAIVTFKVFTAVKIARWVGPPVLVYPCIALAVTSLVWLARYGH